MSCEYLANGSCTFTKSITETALPTSSEICQHCLGCSSPKRLNKATASLIAGHLLRTGKLDPNNKDHIQVIEILSDPKVNRGPGTELRKLISWFPIPNKTGCQSCKSLEIKMNRWGPDTCMEKIKYITKKLEISAKRRSIPFNEFLAKQMIVLAINKSRGEPS